jgi:histidine kinase
LRKALQIFQQQLKLREIEVATALQDDLPPVLADPNRLEQVFVNLLINARDAIEDKWTLQDRPDESKKIFLKTSLAGETVRIEVRDTGTGIPAAVRDRVFEPFFTTKKIGKGTGLGLSISYGIVLDYDGRIWVESEEGKGATFIVEFPVAQGDG